MAANLNPYYLQLMKNFVLVALRPFITESEPAIDGSSIPFSSTVKILSVALDTNPTLNQHAYAWSSAVSITAHERGVIFDLLSQTVGAILHHASVV